MKPPQGAWTAPLPCRKRRNAHPKILHQAHSCLLRVPREVPRGICTGVSVPRKSPLQLLRSQTPATGRRKAPPTTNMAARTNPARSPEWTSIAQKSPIKSPARRLARSPARRSATRRRSRAKRSGATLTRPGRTSPARSEPVSPSAGGTPTVPITYGYPHQGVLRVILDVIVMHP